MWLTAEQAGAHLNRHPETVRKNARLGKLPAYKLNGDWLFNKDELDNFIKNGNNTPTQGARLQGVKKCHVNLLHSKSEEKSGIIRSRHQVVSEYDDLLKQPARPKRKS